MRQPVTTIAAFVLYLAGSACLSQAASQVSARDMFRDPARLFGAKTTEAKDASSQDESKVTDPGERPAQDETAEEQVVPVRSDAGSELPLGLRYSMLKQVAGGGEVEVDPDTVFHSGDRFRLTIQSNGSAFLYIVARGSSGKWSVLFPSPQIAGGNNRIEAGHRYLIPPEHLIEFDDQVGEERLFIMLSRQPVRDLETLIYSLGGKKEASPENLPSQEEEKTLLAAASVEDELVRRIRHDVRSRDLVIEKVEDETGEDSEKAVYVVDASGGPDSRVVADLTLKHR